MFLFVSNFTKKAMFQLLYLIINFLEHCTVRDDIKLLLEVFPTLIILKLIPAVLFI